MPLSLMVDGLRDVYPQVLYSGDRLDVVLPAGWSHASSSDPGVLQPDPVASNLPLPLGDRLLARAGGSAIATATYLSPPTGCPYYTEFRLEVAVR